MAELTQSQSCPCLATTLTMNSGAAAVIAVDINYLLLVAPCGQHCLKLVLRMLRGCLVCSAAEIISMTCKAAEPRCVGVHLN